MAASVLILTLTFVGRSPDICVIHPAKRILY